MPTQTEVISQTDAMISIFIVYFLAKLGKATLCLCVSFKFWTLPVEMNGCNFLLVKYACSIQSDLSPAWFCQFNELNGRKIRLFAKMCLFCKISHHFLFAMAFHFPCALWISYGPLRLCLCKYFCTLTYPIFFSHFINLWFCKELELMLNDCHFAEAKINPVLWHKLILPPDRADMLLMGSARALSLTMLSALWHMTE